MLRRTRDHSVAVTGLTWKISESLSAMVSYRGNHVAVVAAAFVASGGREPFTRRTFLLWVAIAASNLLELKWARRRTCSITKHHLHDAEVHPNKATP